MSILDANNQKIDTRDRAVVEYSVPADRIIPDGHVTIDLSGMLDADLLASARWATASSPLRSAYHAEIARRGLQA